MDQRDFILKLLQEHECSDTNEETSKRLMLDFIQNHEQCFNHDYYPGHVTGSALIVDNTGMNVLLNHHKKLNKWLQFGGHADGHPNPLEVAFREATEETGLTSLKPILNQLGIFDVDVHSIPPHGDKPIHDHYDIRIILSADKNEPYVITDESNYMKWLPLSIAASYNEDSGFRRLIQKAQNLHSLTLNPIVY